MATVRRHIKVWKLAVCSLVLFIIQAGIMHRFSFTHLSFDLLLLLAAYIAIYSSPSGAAFATAGIGFLRDFGSLGRMGGSAIVLVLATCALLSFREEIRHHGIAGETVLAFSYMLLAGTLYAIGTFITSPNAAGLGLYKAFLQAAGTAILCPLFFTLFEGAGIIEKEVTVF